MLSRVWLFSTSQTSLPGFFPWNFPGKNTGVGCHFLLPHSGIEPASPVSTGGFFTAVPSSLFLSRNKISYIQSKYNERWPCEALTIGQYSSKADMCRCNSSAQIGGVRLKPWKYNDNRGKDVTNTTNIHEVLNWQQRMRWLDGTPDSTDISLSKLGRLWRTGRPGVLYSPWGRKEWDMT